MPANLVRAYKQCAPPKVSLTISFFSPIWLVPDLHYLPLHIQTEKNTPLWDVGYSFLSNCPGAMSYSQGIEEMGAWKELVK